MINPTPLPPIGWDEVTAIGALVAAAATVGLFVLGFMGLKQLGIAVESLDLAKKDVRARSLREAKSAAFLQCERFRNEIIPAHGKLLGMIAASKVKGITSEKEKLTFDASNQVLVRRARDWTVATPAEVRVQIIDVLNMLETWAMVFNSGIADMEVAYQPTSDMFCRAVVQAYPMVIYVRATRASDLFTNVEKLYLSWNGRKTAQELARQVHTLSLQLEEAEKHPKPEDFPKAIGTDI
jgi:glycine cleavage system pyridoxal-binding protein P